MTTTHTPTTAGRHPADALLAAFVDGRLGGAEHRLMVAHLSLCESCREVVAETAKTLRAAELAAWLDGGNADDEEEVEPSGGSGKVLRPARSRFRRALPWIGTLAAAAGVTALLVWTPAGRGFLGWEARVGELGALTQGLGEDPKTQGKFDADLYEDGEQGWTVFAGSGTVSDLDAETSFQVGDLVTYLDVALRLGERDHSEVLAARVLDRIDPLVASLHYAVLVKELEKGADLETLVDLHRQAATALTFEDESESRHWYDLGRWAAAGRLASRSENASWFDDPAVRSEGRHLGRRPWPAEVAASLRTIGDLASGGVEAKEWPDLRRAFDDLVEAGGNHDTWR